MENRTYLVTEAEKLTGEKAHVLRYWEDELGMEIHRNSLGHRCYTARAPSMSSPWTMMNTKRSKGFWRIASCPGTARRS